VDDRDVPLREMEAGALNGDRATRERVPGEHVPPEARRLLDRPPGDRYLRRADADQGEESESERGGSVVRLLVAAILAAAIGGAVSIVLASPLAISEPLVIVAGLGGIATGLAARWGGGSAVSRSRSRRIAVAIALLAVVIVQVAVWQLATAQGGVLPLVDYLAETFGLVVPLEFVAAAIGAWATA
jgi:hypothetical protein